MAGFAAIEGGLGLASWLWDLLYFPPWLGPGLFVNVGLTVAGLLAMMLIYRVVQSKAPSPPEPIPSAEGPQPPLHG